MYLCSVNEQQTKKQTKMKDTLTINGKRFKVENQFTNINFEGNELSFTYYKAKFKSKTELLSWYDKVLQRNDINLLNFNGNPYIWASNIMLEDDTIINAPSAKNGDKNWYAYGENYGFIVTVLVTEYI